jgi:hypothetical protein
MQLFANTLLGFSRPPPTNNYFQGKYVYHWPALLLVMPSDFVTPPKLLVVQSHAIRKASFCWVQGASAAVKRFTCL